MRPSRKDGENMNSYVIEKLKEGRANAKLKQSEVAKMIGIKGNTLSNYENGVSEPDIDTFCSLCDIYNIDPSTILNEAYGLGVQGQDFKIKPSEIEHIKKYRALDDSGRNHLDTLLQWESDRVNQLSQATLAAIVELHKATNANGRLIEYFRNASAGTGQVIFDDVYSERITMPDIPEYRRVAYAVKVDGKNMEPLYNDGDILLIEPTCEIDIGEIGIFNVNGLAYVKQLGQDRLISLNKGYDDIPLTEDSVCMGRVVDKLN